MSITIIPRDDSFDRAIASWRQAEEVKADRLLKEWAIKVDVARQLGDRTALSRLTGMRAAVENPEYLAARQAQSQLEGQQSQIGALAKSAQSGNAPALSTLSNMGVGINYNPASFEGVAEGVEAKRKELTANRAIQPEAGSGVSRNEYIDMLVQEWAKNKFIEGGDAGGEYIKAGTVDKKQLAAMKKEVSASVDAIKKTAKSLPTHLRGDFGEQASAIISEYWKNPNAKTYSLAAAQLEDLSKIYPRDMRPILMSMGGSFMQNRKSEKFTLSKINFIDKSGEMRSIDVHSQVPAQSQAALGEAIKAGLLPRGTTLEQWNRVHKPTKASLESDLTPGASSSDATKAREYELSALEKQRNELPEGSPERRKIEAKLRNEYGIEYVPGRLFGENRKRIKADLSYGYR